MDASPHTDASLPALLAEYGDLAAQLPAASRNYAERIRIRLAELDAHIDQHRTGAVVSDSTSFPVQRRHF